MANARKATLLLIVLLLVSIIAVYHAPIGYPPTVSAQPPLRTATLTAIKDAYIEKDKPDTNHGTDTTLWVSGDDSTYDTDERVLIAFDLSSICPHASIKSAKLKIYVQYEGYSGDPLYLSRITGSWTETEVTWNNQPATTSVNSLSTNMPGETGWYEYDVTAQVQDACNEGTEYGVMLKTKETVTTYAAGFASRETSNKPQLYIEYYKDYPVTVTLKADSGSLSSDDYFVAKYYDPDGVVQTAHLTDGSNSLTISALNPVVNVTKLSWLSDSSTRYLISGKTAGTDTFEGKTFQYIALNFTNTDSVTLTYYKQYYVTWRVETTSGPALNSMNYVSGYCYQNGSQIARSPLYDGHDLSDWCDAGENIWVDEQSTLSEPCLLYTSPSPRD